MAYRARLILASASPARRRTMRAAGLSCEVIVSGIDETALTADQCLTSWPGWRSGRPRQCQAGSAQARRPTGYHRLRLHVGTRRSPYGKPETAAAAIERWRIMSGRSGVLQTGHHVILRDGGRTVATYGGRSHNGPLCSAFQCRDRGIRRHRRAAGASLERLPSTVWAAPSSPASRVITTTSSASACRCCAPCCVSSAWTGPACGSAAEGLARRAAAVAMRQLRVASPGPSAPIDRG